MSRKDNSKINRLDEIRGELRISMLQSRINVMSSDAGVNLTAETLLERERVYDAYLRYENTRVDDSLNPYTDALVKLTSEARECLCMLKLTPSYMNDDEEDDAFIFSGGLFN